ncbi:hypothetical protein AbraIFM66951_008462, partial [Aspergillus brasiliensis]
MPTARMNKSCDECRQLPALPPEAQVVCTNCMQSEVKTSKKDKYAPLVLLSVLWPFILLYVLTEAAKSDGSTLSTNLFIDRLLQDPSESAPLYDEFSVLK